MRRAIIIVLATLGVSVAAIVGWYVVEWRTGLGDVAPNVTVDGRSVGLMNADQLTDAIEERAASIRRAGVEVAFDGGSIATTAADLGVVVDEAATYQAVMMAGRSGAFFTDLLSWAGAPWRQRQIPMAVDLPVEEVESFLGSHPAGLVAEPVEPRVELGDDGFVAVPGTEGSRLDVGAATAAVLQGFRPGGPLTLSAPVVPLPTAESDTAAEDLATRLGDLTDRGVTVRLLGQTGRLSAATLRQSIDLSGPLSDPQVEFDSEALQTALLTLFQTVSRAGSDPVFEVEVEVEVEVEDEDGVGVPVLVRPGTTPQGCCGPEAGEVIVAALEGGSDGGPGDVPPADSDDGALIAWASGEGVIEPVGEFTTEHACCEARVDNIQRIAALVRGQYLLPGESFSVNEFVGRRTTEKGFVSAGVIERGRFTESIGGGISQFATTFFNAAFFAGLDLDEYQSHSIYISRYPYGREATLSFPKPDLRVTNSTEFPVLIWSTYDDTSITMTLYSTRHLEVVETGQEQRPFNRCTDVETFRSRTYPDGRVVEDSVVARYRPGEGLDCNGNPTPEP
ncbi:MAG: VanW family protein [Acidimicrobiia bacterium]